MNDTTSDTPAASEDRSVKLSCRDVWKVYGEQPERFFAGHEARENPRAHAAALRDNGMVVACADVSFDVHVGEIFVIMGLSGSGKSTIVRCLSRLVEPTAGEIIFDDRDLLRLSEKDLIDVRRHKMGMVFQNFGLMPHLNVIDNVSFPLRLQGMPLKERHERAERVIELVGLEGREDSFPRELSGGQQQRVGIARSLTVEPELWFLDEPFSALDPLIRRQMQDEFLRLQAVLRKSIVFITHDFMEALRIADRMAIMRDGEVVQIGTPEELVLAPADDYVAEFTREVPLPRVLKAREVVVADVDAADLPRIDADEPVEEVMKLLGTSENGVAVYGANDALIGVATANSVMARIAAA